ncbi:putative meiosis specific protein Hop1 [Aspergillus ruber CBS 135680]|uniref:HORMA domain-containing protein n=1 Tax=Aspergillus ruber (strain CBS 135680) TaxID=1388766 RepID=A0A017S320_ASPRC|nr:uncharacterized protein EURHEDRAFT_416782 [Aspergillus ruber CBS 135680]EYE91024.1 hypothetical protein EURHEDRAFT_416782 [Aspergillus ruber CBS 135680]
MARIKYTGPLSTVQLQRAPVQNKTQTEFDEVSRLKLQECLAVRQQQSMEMVRIMLHVSFGTLFYLREFLPLGSFDDRDLKQTQREQKYSYEEFINGRTRTESPEGSQDLGFGKGKRGQPLKIILRNSDPKADMILDLLEHGVFDALGKNYLEAIQLTVLVDKDEPQNVLETYTFSFKYTGARGDVNSRLESLSLDPVGCIADMKSAQTARTGLEMIVRRLITLSAFLPTLPNKRNLGIHLFYTEDCPPEYEPPGFAKSTNDTFKYPFNENWQRETQSCGTMNSRCHAVGLNVTSLKWTGPDSEGSEALPRIPLQIEYNDKVRREADIELANEEISSLTLSRNESSLEATQDIAERQKLQMMIPTQVSSYPDSDLVPTQPIYTVSATDIGGVNTDHNMRLSQKKILQIEKFSRMQIPGLAKGTDNLAIGLVKCQCGWDGEEPGMITCSFCRTRQHLLCYGFESPNDSRILDPHACYQCLLEPDETQLLREMHTLVLLRRALKIILDEGFPSKTSTFTQKLHCNGQTVVQITDLLRKHKFLQPTPGSKSKGFLQKGLPKFIVASAEDTRERMQREILHPFAKIHHHYVSQDMDSLPGTKPITDDQQLSQGPASSMNDGRAYGQGPQSSDVEGNKNPGHKTRRTQVESHGQVELQGILQPATSLGNGSDKFSRGMMTSDRIRSQPQTPSSRHQSDENPLRRSSRKRRKISNYSRLIDVGVVSGGDESD